MATQRKRGYLRGCRGILITGLNADGSMPVSPTKVWVDTAQEASLEAEIVEGESSDLRGGDRLLSRVQENDVTLGMNIDFTDARFGDEALLIMQGGTLITEEVDGVEEIIGWEAPKVSEQSEKHPFQADLYIQSHNSEGGREAYLRYTFPYCEGSFTSIEHSDQDWGTPEFALRARENPATKASAYSKRFVTGLPDAPFGVYPVLDGEGTATIVTTPSGSAVSGTTVAIAISTVQAGHEVDSVAVQDSNGTDVIVTTVTAGTAYSFVMPRAAVTVTVTMKASA